MRALIFRFGIFEFDPGQHELRRRGLRLPLSLSQARLLHVFVARPGQLVTRDEIASALWTDQQNIDVSNGINTAVNRLRAVFRDDAASPKFIETVVGVGYRFIAAVEVAESTVIPPPASNPDAPGSEEFRSEVSGSPDNSSPVFEPAVAFLLPETTVQETSAMEQGRTRAIRWWTVGLVMFILVAASFAAGSAFLRHRRDVSAEAQPLFPEPFRELTFNDGDDAITASDIAPDGRSVAYSDHSGVSVQMLADGSQRQIPTPADFQVDRISWYAGGAELLVSGVARPARRAQTWVLSLAGAPPRALFASEGDDDAAQATLARDTGQMAFTSKQGTEIWVAGSAGQNPRRLLGAGAGEKFLYLLWSPGGNRLLFERYSAGRLARADSPVGGSGNPVEDLQSLDHWSCESVDPKSGKILAVQDNVRFDSAYMAADGKLFYPVNDSYAELQRARLIEVDTDPATGRFLTAPRTALNFNAGLASSVSASADGKIVTAVLQRRTSDVYIAEVRVPGPTLSAIHRLTSHSLDDLPHAFTPDGGAVLFESRRLGRDAIFEQKLAAASPDHFRGELLGRLPRDAAMPQFTPDGKWILFMEFSGHPSHADAIYRVSSSGGDPIPVYISGTVDEFHCPLANQGSCVLRETVGKSEFVYYALDPISGRGRQLGRAPWTPTLLGDWSISPDGATVAAADHDEVHPGIRLIALSSAGPSQISEISVQGFGTLLETTWSPDARGFFVQSKTASSYNLLYVDRAGNAQLLRQTAIPIWGVPSRDGKRLAFPDQTTNSNVWIGHSALP